jgi:hypothetical protein
MSTNDSGLRDDVAAGLNGSALAPDNGPQPDPVPARPADGAAKEKWVAYVVALGLHPDSAGQFTRGELIELAGRFGG